MFAEFFASKEFADAMTILQNEFPLAIWETFYVTVVSTAIAIIIGLPLGVLLAVRRARTASCRCRDGC